MMKKREGGKRREWREGKVDVPSNVGSGSTALSDSDIDAGIKSRSRSLGLVSVSSRPRENL